MSQINIEKLTPEQEALIPEGLPAIQFADNFGLLKINARSDVEPIYLLKMTGWRSRELPKFAHR